ncbi:MAG TPA: hypothetical protein VNV66_05940 [Pilimelia sp.]|nr:hypothetical protein [Pilimelia sp.]
MFGVYFGALGLALSLLAHFALFHRSDEWFTDLAVPLAVVVVLLGVGWLVMLVMRPRGAGSAGRSI